MVGRSILLLVLIVQSPVLFATGKSFYFSKSRAIRILDLDGRSGSSLTFLKDRIGPASVELNIGDKTILVKSIGGANVRFEQAIVSNGYSAILSRYSKQNFRIVRASSHRFFFKGNPSGFDSGESPIQALASEGCGLREGPSGLATIEPSIDHVGPSCGGQSHHVELKSKVNATLSEIFKIKVPCVLDGSDLVEGIQALKQEYDEMSSVERFPISCADDQNTFSDVESGQIHLAPKVDNKGLLEPERLGDELAHEVAHLVIYRQCKLFRLKVQNTSAKFFGRTIGEIPSCAALPDEGLAREVSIQLRECAENRSKVSALYATAKESEGRASNEVVDQLIPVEEVADAAAMAKHEEGLKKVAEALDGKGDLASEVKTLAAASSFGIKGPDNPFGVPEAPVRRAAEKMGRLVSSAGFPGSIMERVANAVLGSPPASAKPESQVQGSGTQVRAPATVDIPSVQYRSLSEPSAVENNSEPDSANNKDSRNDAPAITSGARSKSISGPNDNSEKLALTKLVGGSARATPEVRSGDRRDNLTQVSRASSGGGFSSGEGGSAGGIGLREPSRGEQEPSRAINEMQGKGLRSSTEKFALTLNGIKQLDFKSESHSPRSPTGTSSVTEVNQFLTWARSHEQDLNSNGVQINYKSKSDKLESIGSAKPRFNYLLRCDSQSCKLTLVNKNGSKP